MAYALPGEARITVPPPPPPVGLIDPGTLILSPPPPVAYLVPLGAIPRHGHQGAVFVQNPVLVPRNHSLVSPPVILRLNPAFLMQMDEHRTRSLLQVHGPESDIDALCVGPYFATLEVSYISRPIACCFPFIVVQMQLEMVQEYCDPNPTENVDHNITEPNIVFYWGLSHKGNTFINIGSLKKDFMKSLNTDQFADGNRNHCKLGLSIVQYSQLPKSLRLDASGAKGSEPCGETLDNNYLQKPVYSQYLPQYFVGYVANEQHRAAAG
ncbi:hypothetical protein BHM03_00004801 [Ensete ventricosum]|nr:hypothetical protein BHM03_00004801 [Ensete ventricosum]